jgi:hypothetical protein
MRDSLKGFDEGEIQRTATVWVSRSIRRSLLLVHGSGTLGKEMLELKDAFDNEGFNVDVRPVPIDLVPIVGVLYWAKRRKPRNEMGHQISQAVKEYASTDELSIAAHSYGTFLLTWWLRSQGTARFRNVILLASIVKRKEISALTNIADRVIVDVIVTDKVPCVAEAMRPDQSEATGSFGMRGHQAFGRGQLYDRFYSCPPEDMSFLSRLRRFPSVLFCGTGHSHHLNVLHFKDSVLKIVTEDWVPQSGETSRPLNQSTVHWIRLAAIGLALLLIATWTIWSWSGALIMLALVFVIFWIAHD